MLTASWWNLLCFPASSPLVASSSHTGHHASQNYSAIANPIVIVKVICNAIAIAMGIAAHVVRHYLVFSLPSTCDHASQQHSWDQIANDNADDIAIAIVIAIATHMHVTWLPIRMAICQADLPKLVDLCHLQVTQYCTVLYLGSTQRLCDKLTSCPINYVTIHWMTYCQTAKKLPLKKDGVQTEEFLWKEAWEEVDNRWLSPKTDKECSLFQLKPSVWDSDRGVGSFYKGPDGGTNRSPSLYKSLQIFGHCPSCTVYIWWTCFWMSSSMSRWQWKKHSHVLLLGVVNGCKLPSYSR